MLNSKLVQKRYNFDLVATARTMTRMLNVHFNLRFTVTVLNKSNLLAISLGNVYSFLANFKFPPSLLKLVLFLVVLGGCLQQYREPLMGGYNEKLDYILLG